MANVKIKNVEHGNCVLITNIKNQQNEDLIVVRDFGSKDPNINNNLAAIIEKMATKRCSGKHYEAILTHPHYDHCSGYKAIHNKGMRSVFDKAYIPWLDFETDLSLHSKMLKTSLYIIYYFPNSKISKKAKNWTLMAPMMYDLSEQLIGLYKGNIINWSQNAEVYWPPLPTQINKTAANNCGYLHPDRQGTALDVLIHEFSKNSDAQQFVDSVYNNIIPIYRVLFNNATNIQDRNIHDFILNEIIKLENSSPGKAIVSAKINQNKYLYKNIIDDHSIVFELKAEKEDGKPALFLSDFNGKAMEYMTNDILQYKTMDYALLLSAHHGTRISTSFSNKVKADDIVNCCGKGQANLLPLHQGYFDVSMNNIYCTSWNICSPNWSKKCIPPYILKPNIKFHI